MLPNEVFALECIARYAREGLDVKEGGVHDGYPDEFAHCPYPRPKGQTNKKKGDRGYYLTFFDHQKQGLLQSVDEGRKCYMIQKVYLYLNTMPPGHEELRVIYDKFNVLTKEHKDKLSVAKSGTKHPRFGMFGALNPHSKAMIAIEPDGTQLHFGGVSEAARELGIPLAQLSRLLNSDKQQPRCGKFKNYQFFYEVKE